MLLGQLSTAFLVRGLAGGFDCYTARLVSVHLVLGIRDSQCKLLGTNSLKNGVALNHTGQLGSLIYRL